MKKRIGLGLAISVALAMSACETLQIDGGSVTIDFAVPITAHVYENKETGELLYCSNKHDGDPQDFEYKGTAEVPPSEKVSCHLQ